MLQSVFKVNYWLLEYAPAHHCGQPAGVFLVADSSGCNRREFQLEELEQLAASERRTLLGRAADGVLQPVAVSACPDCGQLRPHLTH